MFLSFSFGVLGQVWYLIDLIPDLCLLPYLAISIDPHEMPHNATFYLGIHCLPKLTFRSHYCNIQRVKCMPGRVAKSITCQTAD